VATNSGSVSRASISLQMDELPKTTLPHSSTMPVSSFSDSVSELPDSSDIEPEQIPAGTDDLDSLSNVSISTWHNRYKKIAQLKDDELLTEAAAFPRVFGFKYVKSTACSYKWTWECTPKSFQDAFLHLGDVKQAFWRNFKLALRRKKLPLYACQASGSSAPKPLPAEPEDRYQAAVPSSKETLRPFPTQLSSIQPSVTLAESILELVKHESEAISLLDEEPDLNQNLCPFCDQPLPDSPL